MSNGLLALIIAMLLAIVAAQALAFLTRETGGSVRETLESGGRAFRWTLGVCVTALAIYAGPEAIEVIQHLPRRW
jgi:hypothetical protein